MSVDLAKPAVQFGPAAPRAVQNPLVYGDICSGISAPTVAWQPLGWRSAFYSEIEAFPRAVLGHHFPQTPLHGDFTTVEAGQYEPIDLLVGGTPCQDFSVAGLRAGMAGDRGNLTLQFLALARRLRPEWLVWENVPGVLSSNGGRDFGAFLGGLGELGYGWAYRTLDAQHFGVPQRRRRVFVVGHLGDWRRAAAVLFERHCLQGHPAPRREAGESITGPVTACAGTERKHGFGWGQQEYESGFAIAHALNAKGGSGRSDGESETFVASTLRAYSGRNQVESTYLAHTLSADGFDASEDGTGRGTPLTVIPLQYGNSQGGKSQGGLGVGSGNGPMYTIDSEGPTHAVAFGWQASPAQGMNPNAITPSLDKSKTVAALHGMAVRRLTPRECERLQGFPDDFTLVPYRGKPAADGPRYKAIGNSMAVPVVRWIGERIAQVIEATGARAAPSEPKDALSIGRAP